MFDYYYGTASEQFSFYRIPRLLIKDKRFKYLSSNAKLLYGLMLDRMSLSMKNGWFDDKNRVYIYYTLESIMEDLGCSKPTCIKVIAELDDKKGIGLIERKKQGLGKPDMIYVKNFVLSEDQESEVEDGIYENVMHSTEVKKIYQQKEKYSTFEDKESELQEVKEFYSHRLNIFSSGGKESEHTEEKIFNPNYNNTNYTDLSYNNPIYQSDSYTERGMDERDDVNAYIEIIKENIEYEHHMKYDSYQDKVLYNELFDIICEVVCVNRKTIKIGGDDYPYELVKSKFLKLNSSHLEYVIECMKNTTSKIISIKSYIMTALYNASSTINHFYQQSVIHDMHSDLGR